MKDNKNIERLFQEKFKDFEAMPPQESWNVIASRLTEKKKKKRVIPIWFRYSGIAASLFLIGGLIWNFTLNNNDSENLPNFENSIVNTDESIPNQNGVETNSSINNAVVYDSDLNDSESKINSDGSFSKVNGTENTSTIKKNLLNKNIRSSYGKSNSVVSTNKFEKNIEPNSNQNFKIKTNKKHNKQRAIFTNSNDAVLSNVQTNNSKRKSKYNSNKNDLIVENEILNDNELVVDNKKNDKTAINKEVIDSFFEKETSNSSFVNNNNNDSIATQTTNSNVVVSNEIIAQDSTLIAEVLKETNPLEELLKEKEAGKNEDEKEEKQSRWAVSTNASPVYFNSIAEGSSLDSRFNSNKKEYNNTLSFGLGLNYSINKKLVLKTGINNLSLDYNTSDISFYQSTSSKPIEHVDVNSRGRMINIESKLEDNGTFISVTGNLLNKFDGVINQKISYIEVPVELGYKILDRKFGIELIGGLSTLFLNNNSVSVVTNGQEMNIGKANNLNNIHFSSNVGLGFKYSFWKSFNANFQPMFKYQINTFSENSSNFKPYFIGLYTGISFSF